MDVSVMRPAELGAAAVRAWHALQDQSPSLANPFLCPEFTQAVGRYRSAARVAIISDGVRPVGFFPFERRGLGVGLPIGAGLTDCQGLVCAPGAEWDPADLLRACGLSAWHFDHLVGDQQPFARCQVATAASPVMDLTDGFTAYLDRIRSGSLRFWRNLEREERKLEREVGLVKLVADSPDIGDLRTMMAWKSAQYQRTGRADPFAHQWITNLVVHLLSHRQGPFRGMMSVLYAGGVPVARSFGLLHSGVFAGWFTSYDPCYHRYSPGLIQLLRLAQELPEYGVRTIDMGKGDKWYKDKFKSYDLVVGEGTATTRSALAAVHRTRLGLPSWAERQVRAHHRLFAAADYVLKGYGRVRLALRRRAPDRP